MQGLSNIRKLNTVRFKTENLYVTLSCRFERERVREGGSERGREREGEREGGGERGREREGERERERGREREY